MNAGRAAGMSCIALVLLTAAAQAEPASVRLGPATIRYDAARFTVTSSAAGADFSPQPDAKDLSSVKVRVVSGAEADCDTLLLRAFEPNLYAVEYMQSFPIAIGGRKGVRYSVHTRCRNATPIGEAACVNSGARAYLLTSVQVSCRSANPFVGTDALKEIARGIAFDAPPN